MPSDQTAHGSLKMTALSVADAATVLSRSGGRTITEAMLRNDIESGAPANLDGTINLVQYAAWLVAKETHGD